jgi:hypothetical protein
MAPSHSCDPPLISNTHCLLPWDSMVPCPRRHSICHPRQQRRLCRHRGSLVEGRWVFVASAPVKVRHCGWRSDVSVQDHRKAGDLSLLLRLENLAEMQLQSPRHLEQSENGKQTMRASPRIHGLPRHSWQTSCCWPLGATCMLRSRRRPGTRD